MKKTLILLCALLGVTISFAAQKSHTLASPDGSVELTVNTEGHLSYSVSMDGVQLLSPSEISMTLVDGTVFGNGDKVRKVVRTSSDEVIATPVYFKSGIQDKYNQLELQYKNYKVIFRAYDDGVAYRFVSLYKTPFIVASEQAEFAFPENWKAFVPYVCQNTETLESQMHNSYENTYSHISLSDWNKDRLAFLPLMVEVPGGVKMCVTESDLLSYPGMFLYNSDGDSTLTGMFAKFPLSKEKSGVSLFTKSTADYLAEYTSGCNFPWRIIAMSRRDCDMTANDMVFRLATPADPSVDYSWVKPGKVSWEWWHGSNLYGVDFKAGRNNETYQYYIDFASEYGIPYIILDGGWYSNDLFTVTPTLNLPELIAYGKERNVDIILWAGFADIVNVVEKACKVYSEMGVKGFKIDFMDSDDQTVVDFHRTTAETAAKYHLLLDYHGTYKPVGLNRTYPNVLNYEGVFGLENMKWNGEADMVTYDVTLPYIRMFAGPADYTQGAMVNASRRNFRAVGNEPMSQGTRCHQIAEYVVFNAPLNMLCDSPSNYLREKECIEFIASVPNVWDETVPVDGKVGEFIATARRSGDDWYLAALNGWNARELSLPLDFLPSGEYEVTLFRDGVNADRAARDYKKEILEISGDMKAMSVRLAKGGGFVAKISRK